MTYFLIYFKETEEYLHYLPVSYCKITVVKQHRAWILLAWVTIQYYDSYNEWTVKPPSSDAKAENTWSLILTSIQCFHHRTMRLGYYDTLSRTRNYYYSSYLCILNGNRSESVAYLMHCKQERLVEIMFHKYSPSTLSDKYMYLRKWEEKHK